MKKNFFFILLLSVVSLTVVAAEEYPSYEKAAEASHKTLRQKFEDNKGSLSSNVKSSKEFRNKIKNATLKYNIVSTKFVKQVNDTNRQGRIKKEAQRFAFEGNLTISKTTEKSKYVVTGYFDVSKDSLTKGSGKNKVVSIIYHEHRDKVMINTELVPYFETEALNKANELVKKYYDQHKEFVEVNIQPAKPCQDGYKVTTSRTYYKDAQKYIFNKGTVIFTVKKADQLKDFQLLEQTEDDLKEFDLTPVSNPKEGNETAQETETITKDNRTNQEKLEQTTINAFSLNSIALSDDSKEQLDQAAQILLEDKSVEIELLGHTCNLGDEETNYNFGILRAKEAKKYLVSKGVESNRIYVHSYGAKKPLVPNTNAESKGKNRRVEIKVIK